MALPRAHYPTQASMEAGWADYATRVQRRLDAASARAANPQIEVQVGGELGQLPTIYYRPASAIGLQAVGETVATPRPVLV